MAHAPVWGQLDHCHLSWVHLLWQARAEQDVRIRAEIEARAWRWTCWQSFITFFIIFYITAIQQPFNIYKQEQKKQMLNLAKIHIDSNAGKSTTLKFRKRWVVPMPVSPNGVSWISAFHFRTCGSLDELWIFRVWPVDEGPASFKYGRAEGSETTKTPSTL